MEKQILELAAKHNALVPQIGRLLDALQGHLLPLLRTYDARIKALERQNSGHFGVKPSPN